jgi:transcription initiation factor TFIIIB Brf1 subunit/transcription initiation factor TFIIB
MTQGPSNCYRCQSDDVVLDLGRGDQVCRNCGEVINQRVIDESSEWRIYMNDDRGRGESMVRCSYEDKNSILPSYTNFIGGTSIQRSALEKSQLMIEKNSTLKLMLDIDAVKDLADKLDLTPAIKVRTFS